MCDGVSGPHPMPVDKRIVSEQGGTVPPCLWNPDRIDLSSPDQQAEKRPQPTANILDTSSSVAASGNACQMFA